MWSTCVFAVTSGLFYPKVRLIDYLMKRNNARDERDLERLYAAGSGAARLKKDMKNLKVTTNHLRTNKVFSCDGTTPATLKNTTFDSDEKNSEGEVIKKQRISIVDYYETKYNIRLRCSNMPGLQHKSRFRGATQVSAV